MQKLLPAALLGWLFAAPLLLLAQPKIQLTPFATGFLRPVDIEHAGDSRLFVVEQRGYIWMLDSLGNRLQDTFLNIDDRVRYVSTENERGLLGLAFPPDFAQTGVFYVNYTREPDGYTRVSRFSLKPGNPNQADPASEEILLTQSQPYVNHNGGCLKFGPDGYLYIGFGDGGSSGDPQNRAQNKSTWLGKMLRIDVNSVSPGKPYGIPADNPFVNDTAFLPEIWSWGLRNPWRFSFDRLNGDLWIADVGQGAREEIDFEPAHTGGRNYGWRCYEGTQAYSTSGCPPITSFTAPVFDYAHSGGNCSVTGGFMYRGNKFPDLYGNYLFTDYCTGVWWALHPNPDGTFSTKQIADLDNSQYTSFGQDRNGELYVTGLSSGIIYKINELCSSFQVSGTVTDATCNGTFDGVVDLNLTGGLPPYTFAWSNGQTDSAIVYLNPGTYTVQAQDARGCIRRDTFEVGATQQLSAAQASVVSWTAPLDTAGLLCTGDTVLLEASEAPAGFGYQWYKDNQAIAGGTGRQFFAREPGQYHVEHTGLPCHSPASADIPVQLIQLTFPEPAIIVSGASTLCPGDSTALIALSLPGNYQFQWLRDGVPVAGATGTQLSVHEAGLYTIQYSTTACLVYTAAPVNIDVALVPVTQVLPIGTPVICGDVPAQLMAVQAPAGWGYQWYLDGTPVPGATDILFIAGAPGNYQVQYTGAPCGSYLSLPTEVLQSAAPVIQQNGGNLSISGTFLSVQWVVYNAATQAWEPIPNATSTAFQAVFEGLFAVQVVDALGCSFQTDPVGVSATTFPANVHAFTLAPNPTRDQIRISLELARSESVVLTLHDAALRQIFRKTAQGQRIAEKFDLEALPAGTYYLHVQLEHGSLMRSVVKE